MSAAPDSAVAFLLTAQDRHGRMAGRGQRSEADMGVFDQAANYGYRAAPHGVTGHVLKKHRLPYRFHELDETRTTPLPGQRDRTADKVAILEDPKEPAQPWLLLWEFQARHDAEKLDVTFVEADRLRTDFRHGPERKDKYKVLTALVYLTGVCPESELNRLAGGFGSLHRPLIWNVGEDQALAVLDEAAAEQSLWGLLFWVALMRGGGVPGTIARWVEVVTQVAPGRRERADLGKVALVFAELAGCRPAWEQALRNWDMTESQLFLEWTAEAKEAGKVENARAWLIDELEARFPGAVTSDVRELIAKQDSKQLLDDWHKVALKTPSFDTFRAQVMR
jgi:hypothetical protein